jgi:radical SAM superfamily enzyme YgiQ (UPF0313 family)
LKETKLRILLFTTPTGLVKGAVEKPSFGIQPLGVLYLASALNEWADFEYSIKVVDAYTFGHNADDIKNFIKDFKPNIVGVSAVTILIHDAQYICSLAKGISPDILTVIGGPHASTIPTDAAQHKDTDLAVIGEGEIIFLELCRTVLNREKYQSIAGIAYRDNGHIIVNDKKPPIDNLDEIPFPNLSLVPDLEHYNPMPHWGKSGHFSTMITSRGCPYDCSFCSVTADQGQKYRYRSPENIVEEIKDLRKKYTVTEVSFRDGTFTTNKKRVTELCNLMIKEKLNVEWSCNVRANELDPELLRLMKKAGCNFVFYGIEQGNSELLWKHKKLRKEKVREAARWVKEAGMDVQGYFIMGMPEENMTTLQETIDFAKSLPLNSAVFTILSPFPGTKVYDYCESQELLLGYDWDRFDARAGLAWKHPNLTEEQLVRMMKKAYRSFYLRPYILIDRLKHIKSWRDVVNHVRLFFSFLK